MVSSTSAKSNCIPSKKLSLKEKFMNNFKAEFDNDYDENVLPASSLSRANHKINVRSKINL
ncbi:hypothetical protein X975_26894, partial [Stegodyphus mimosarum]